MDTVLGLSMTPTTIGWVLLEGHDADGTILDQDEFEVHSGGGVRAVNTAEQAAAAVLHAQARATADDQGMRVIGVTWSDDATAEAAVLLESLTDAGFDNVVPIRLLEAVETLARAIALVIGYEQTAVCVLEHESATVVMVDTCDDETRTAVKHVRGGRDGLIRWLTAMFDRGKWQPAGVVVVGSDSDLDAISWQLEEALPVPVFAHNEEQLAVTRGAALAAAQSTDFTDARLVELVGDHSAAPARYRQLSYAGALTMLVAGAVTLMASLSLAVGLRLAPEKHPGAVEQVMHTSAPHIAQAVTPAVPPSPEVEAPAADAALEPAPAEEPQAAEPITPQQQPSPPPPAPPPESNSRPPPLTRVLEHIQGLHGDSAPPAPAQVPPPNAGPPSP